jgi:pantetheine-phosphate adenylyltransferase
VCAIIRGLRQISDFGDEFTINGMVARSLPEIPLTYFICRQDFLHVSSSSVKEMAALGEDVSWMVTPTVLEYILQRNNAKLHVSP